MQPRLFELACLLPQQPEAAARLRGELLLEVTDVAIKVRHLLDQGFACFVESAIYAPNGKHGSRADEKNVQVGAMCARGNWGSAQAHATAAVTWWMLWWRRRWPSSRISRARRSSKRC